MKGRGAGSVAVGRLRGAGCGRCPCSRRDRHGRAAAAGVVLWAAEEEAEPDAVS